MPETTPQPSGFTLVDFIRHVAKREPSKHLQQMHDFTAAVDTLALTMDAEGRSQSVNGRIAIAWTVRNRQLGKGPFRDSGKPIPDICLRSAQYSCRIPQGGDKNFARTLRMAQAVMAGGLIEGVSQRQWDQLQESRYLAQGVLQGRLLDPTGGAAHYLTQDLYGNVARPRWVADATGTKVIEDHVFLKGIR